MNIEKIEIHGHYVWVDKDASVENICYYYNSLDKEIRKGSRLYQKYHHKIIAASPELNLEGVPTYVEWLGLNELKLKWEHLYINGQLPKKPYPTNFENDLDKFMLGYYTALEKELQKQLITEIMNEDAKDGLYESQPTWDDVRKAIQIAKDSMGVDNDGETCYSHLSTEQIVEQLKQSKQ